VRSQPNLNLTFIKRKIKVENLSDSRRCLFLPLSMPRIFPILVYREYKSNFIAQVVLLDRISPSFMPVARQHVAVQLLLTSLRSPACCHNSNPNPKSNLCGWLPFATGTMGVAASGCRVRANY